MTGGQNSYINIARQHAETP